MTSTRRRWRRWAMPALPVVAAWLLAGPAGTAWARPAGPPASTARPSPAPGGASRGPGAMTPTQQAEALVAKMTLAQKITELHGIQDAQHQRYVPGIPSLGIPPLVITNGPAGVGPGDDPIQQPATALPAPISLAASFDPGLAYRYGRLIGRETADLGENLLEGPDVNIVRVPQAGRTFESLSEDPYLDGAIGTAEIQGIQAQPGVIAEVKHFDAYNQETYRNTPADDDIVTGRTLHEIYMPAFQQAVTRGGAQSVMCSYASINGTYSCQDPYLLSDTLRQRWGFDGFVQSDFGAAHSTAASAQAGLDLEMPTGDYYASPMEQAVESGQVPIGTVNQMLVRRFSAMIRQGLFSHPAATHPIPAQADGAFARSAAEQGIVLLKNTSGALPLKASAVGSIAVIGPYAGSAMTGGGGSSHVDPLYTVSPVQGIKNAAGPGVTVTYNDGSDPAAAAAAAKSAGAAIVMVGDTESEGHDQPSLALSGDQDQLVQAVAAANPHTIVVVKSGNPVLMPWLNQVPAVLEAWYPGEEDGNAVAAVLFGTVDPSGKLPVTFPASASQTPTSSPSQFPGTGGQVHYSEGLDVGYRGYDAENITPMFPFGYGLSYTSFAFSRLHVTPVTVANRSSGPGATDCGCNGQNTKLATVTATVTNTGKRAGAEVAQLYVGDPAAAGEPPRQLKGFQKVFLRPGRSATVRFALTGHDLSYWDDAAGGWVVPDGTFHVYVGDSSALAGLPLRGAFTVTRTVGARYATLTVPSAPVAPGSTIQVSATFTNDGDYAVPPARPSLRVPRGWTARPAGPASISLAPHQGVTAHWSVGVPVAAQGTSATLTASLTHGRAGPPAGNLAATATVTVRPGLTVSAGAALVNAGQQGTSTLTVTSNLPAPVTLAYTASPPSGITVTPAQASITVPPTGTTATLQVRAAAGQSPGSYPVPVSLDFTYRGHSYELPGFELPAVVAYPSLTAAYDNVGITSDSTTAPGNFAGDGTSYSEQQLTAAGLGPGAAVSLGGVRLAWPDAPAGQPDNVVASGQTILLAGTGTRLAILGAADFGSATGTGTIIYADGTTRSFTLTLADWYANQAAPGTTIVATTPSWNGASSRHPVSVYGATVPLQAGKQVAAITLPDVSSGVGTNVTAMHIFAIAIGG
jgi:beta-glucosidase